MKWKKLGHIFDPTEHDLPCGCFAFAQSPQAIVFDNFIRIFFSTRQKDGSKFLSQVCFVDFDKTLKNILNISSCPVIGLGKPGAFDEHGIFPMNVLRSGSAILAYTTGWTRRVSVSVDAAVGLAISYDGGLSFQKTGDGPVLGPTLHEPFLVGDAFVMHAENIYHMWYISGLRWIATEEQPQRVYKIFHATSEDGVSWHKENKRTIPDSIGENECQALPTVVEINSCYHMFFCYRQPIGFRTDKHCAYRIGYAHSDDCWSWQRDDAEAGIDVSGEGWDSQMICYPHVFRCEDNIYMLYNGNEFGKYGFGAAVMLLEEKMNIKGKTITLRAIEKRDLETLHKWANDAETQDIMGNIYFPSSIEFHHAWFDKLQNDPLNQRLAIDTPDCGIIGISSIMHIDWKNRRAYHGVMLGDIDTRGKGYGKDAVMTTMRYAFDEMQLVRLDGSMIEYNTGSIAFYSKLGWKEEGRRRSYYFHKGRYWDQVVVGVTKADYDEVAAGYWDTGKTA